MAKVKLSTTIIGTPEEMQQYGGGLPADAKKFEKRMSEQERAMYGGKLYAGTEMEVSDRRAKELSDAGLIEGSEKKSAPGEKILVRDAPREKAAAPAPVKAATAPVKTAVKTAAKKGKK